MKFDFVSHSLEETAGLAEKIARSLRGGEVIALFGDLGSGKTAFCSALAEKLGCPQTVTSPTFVIFNRYRGRFTVNHFDMYRISTFDELYDTGYFDAAGAGDSVTLIEWAENIIDFIPEPDIIIKAGMTPDGTGRIFSVSGGADK